MIKIFLNPEWHQNPTSGSKVLAILLKGWILPIGGASSGRVCARSLRSRLVSIQIWLKKTVASLVLDYLLFIYRNIIVEKIFSHQTALGLSKRYLFCLLYTIPHRFVIFHFIFQTNDSVVSFFISSTICVNIYLNPQLYNIIMHNCNLQHSLKVQVQEFVPLVSCS